MVNEKQISESLDDSIFKNEIKGIVEKRVLEVIKCQGPSTGYVDGVQYQKDNKQRFHEVREPNKFAEKGYLSHYEAYNGDIENKQIKAQDKVNWSEDEQLAFSALAEDTANTVGYDLHGEDWGNTMDAIGDDSEYNSVFGADEYGFPSGADIWYEDAREDYVKQRVDDVNLLQGMFDKSPGLQGDQQLYTLDIPNPNLQEGDVFELDTYMSASYKQAYQENKYNKYEDSAIDTNTNAIRNGDSGSDRNGLRETNWRENATDWRGNNVSGDLPYHDAYKVAILGSDGTPVLINQGNITNVRNDQHYPVSVDGMGRYDFDASDYWDAPSSPHDVFFNKGQKMRVVRIDHENKTAIYQTVDG